MKKPRDPRLGKRPRIKSTLLKETLENRNSNEDYKSVLRHKSENADGAGK